MINSNIVSKNLANIKTIPMIKNGFFNRIDACPSRHVKTMDTLITCQQLKGGKEKTKRLCNNRTDDLSENWKNSGQ